MSCETNDCIDAGTSCENSKDEPIGTTSNDALACNASTIDEIVNSTGVVRNRIGNQVNSITQLEANYIVTAINGGVWAAGQTFTAFNQYMVFGETAYKPKISTSLPYIVGATPDPLFVEPFDLSVNATFVSTTNDLIASVLSIPNGEVKASKGFTIEGDGGGGFWLSTGVVIAASQTPSQTLNGTLSNGLGEEFIYVKNGPFINVDHFGANDTDDARLPIQSAINFAENLSSDSTITGSGKVYTLNSVSVLPTYGGNVGLYIINSSRVHVDLNNSIIQFDATDLVLGAIAKDALFALAPTTSDESASVLFVNARLIGGDFVDESHKPDTVFKADYFKMRYGTISEVQCDYAQVDVFSFRGFVFHFDRCRARFAGVNGAGFKFATVSGGANTTINVSSCAVDFAGLYGFLVTGTNGHTNCHFDNCAADFIGRDSSSITIPANVGLAYAYYISDVRVFNMTACGCEFSNSILKLKNARSFRVDGLFGVGMGHSDGLTEIDNNINITGFYEQISFKNFENRSPLAGGFDTIMAVENPGQFNTNNIQLDDSINPITSVRFDGGNQSSSETPLIKSPQDLYLEQNRRGAGDVIKTGAKAIGADINAWFDSNDVLENTFWVNTSGSSVAKDLLNIELDNGGALGFEIEFMQTRSIPNLSSASFIGWVHYEAGVATIQQPERKTATLLAGSGSFPTVAFAASKITVTMPNTFTGYLIKVTVTPRPGANYVRINWL